MVDVVPVVPVDDDDAWAAAPVVVTVREFNAHADLAAVERLEWACEVGPSDGKLCLFTDLLGDPLCRVRHSPPYLMLAAAVFRHESSAVAVLRLPPRDAELLYRARFAGVEFFPRDIDAVLANPLSLGTFLAVPAAAHHTTPTWWRRAEAFLAAPPGGSWAVASVWNCKDAFRLQVRGAPRLWRAAARATRAADRALSPWLLRLPSVPNLFDPFGMHFLYGLAGAGPAAPAMARALCRHAHSLARRAGARVVATELAAADPLRAAVPHRPCLGAQDLWCVKRLADGYGDGALGDWTKAPPGDSIFVDPREF